MTPPPSGDPFELRRFLDAQFAIYSQVIEELSARRKRSHWMWFVFPQIAGLGASAMAQRFAIGSKAEAAAYLPRNPWTSSRRMHPTDDRCERKDNQRNPGVTG
jgi:uncharacterized protein (DUF1810 family)